MRGAITVTRVNDFRDGESEIRWLDESRDVMAAKPVESQNAGAAAALRWFGWIALAVFFGAFVCVRARRTR